MTGYEFTITISFAFIVVCWMILGVCSCCSKRCRTFFKEKWIWRILSAVTFLLAVLLAVCLRPKLTYTENDSDLKQYIRVWLTFFVGFQIATGPFMVTIIGVIAFCSKRFRHFFWGWGKRIWLPILGLVVFEILIAGIEFGPKIRYCSSLEDLQWNLFYWFEDDTQYADGYSESKFKKIKPGMTEAEVVTLMGPPLDENSSESYGNNRPTNEERLLRYSRRASDSSVSSYWGRTVIIGQDGTVKEVNRYYWCD